MYAPSRESSMHESYRQGVFFTNATTPFLGNAIYDFICGVEGTVILVCVFPDVCAPFRRTSMERFSTILRNSLLFWDFLFQLLNFSNPIFLLLFFVVASPFEILVSCLRAISLLIFSSFLLPFPSIFSAQKSFCWFLRVQSPYSVSE